MSDLKRTSVIVKKLLEEKKETRESDMLLYVEVCRTLCPESLEHPMWYVLLHLKEFGLPNTETVRRSRQKMQEKYPELASSARVQRMRAEREERFRAFARSNPDDNG